LPRPRCIWRRMTQVSSRDLNCSSMGAERRSRQLPRLKEPNEHQHDLFLSITQFGSICARAGPEFCIIGADISRGWKNIWRFLTHSTPMSRGRGDTQTSSVRGKERIRRYPFQFSLGRYHVMAEIGGLSIQIRRSRFTETSQMRHIRPVSRSDRGVSRTCKLAWCTRRRWAETPAWCTNAITTISRPAAPAGDDLIWSSR